MEKLSDIQIINRLQVIFQDNNWELDKENNKSMYNRFTKILKALNREQQELFLELSDNFVLYSLEEYENLLIKSLHDFMEHERTFFSMPGKKSVYVVPIVNDGEFTVKSSFLTAYLIKSNTLQYDDSISSVKWHVMNSLDSKQINSINKSDNKKVIIIDDFIGSGETAIRFYNNCIENSVENNKLSILALVCSTKAGDDFVKQKIPYYIGEEAKSLDDICFSEADKVKKINIINEINEKLGINEKDKLGYGNIMTLISMVRTPNNTLPIFWKSSKKFQAPFPRL